MRKKAITKTFCLGFSLLFISLGGGGLFFLNEIKTLSNLTSSIFHHPLVVSTTSLECSLAITKMHRTMKDIVLFSDPDILADEIGRINRQETRVYANLDIIQDKILGVEGKALEEEARAMFRAWKPIRDEVITLVLKHQTEAAALITKNKGARHVNLMEAKMGELTAYARNKASEFLSQSERTGNKARSISLGFLILGMIFILITGGLTIVFSSRFEDDLVQSEHHHRVIFENSPLGMIRFSPEGSIVDMNEKFASMMGSTKAKLLGFNTATQSPPAMQESIKTALAGRTSVYEDLYPSASGKTALFLRVIFNPVSPGSKKTEVIATLEDITERKAAEQEREENERRLNTIFNSVQTGIFIIDKETHTLLDVNSAAETMVGMPRSEMTGKPWNRLICAVDQDSCPIIDLEQTRENSERILLTADNRERPILTTITEVSIRGRACLLECFVDISRQKEIEQGLREAKEAAEAATLAKANFLANMSHEIRTPMNGVIGMTELLAGTELNREQKEYVSTIAHSSDALLEIINDILDHSKIDAGKVELESIEFNLRTLLESIADLTAVKAQEKGLEYCTIIHPQTPSFLIGDPGRLRQILLNLIGNAVKFTRQGEVVVETRVEREGRDHAVVKFLVTDTGIGIPEDKLDILFDSFSQVDTSTTRKFGGTGLGLTISRQLTKLMGGRIQVDSTLGSGSCFSFTAAFKKVVRRKEGHRIPRKKSLKGNHILIVDDNKTNRFVLKADLANWGCRVEEADDGYTALDKLISAENEGDGFDIAVIDMQMPGMDGETLGREIKQYPAISSLRMIMLTSMGMRGDAWRFQGAGFSAYLNKPVKQQELFDCLTMVHPDNAAAQLPGPIITKHVIAENQPPPARILLAEDNKINKKVALANLRKLGFSSDAVTNGKEAVEALQATDYDLVLMDCQMPEMDGYEATRHIRNGDTGVLAPEVPIIAMTANAMDKDREKCLAAGMNDYLAKPVKAKDLSAMLSKWLE
ncbi:MAG: response regulator [Desulfobacterales bacterium]|nr:response regulator [Desulfobacterales bacterium]